MKNELKQYMLIGTTKDDMAGVQISPDLDAAMALQLLGTLALHILKAYTAVADKQLDDDKTLKGKDLKAAKQGIQESLYDAADTLFSSVLAQYYPDAPKNGIEEEAIVKLQNELIEQRYNAMSEKERKAFKRQYDKMKYVLQLTKKSKTDSNLKETVDNEE